MRGVGKGEGPAVGRSPEAHGHGRSGGVRVGWQRHTQEGHQLTRICPAPSAAQPEPAQRSPVYTATIHNNVIITIISLLMSPLLGHRPSLWIAHEENEPYPPRGPSAG
jgi:hypothetical protein